MCTTLYHIIPNRPYHLLILQHIIPFSKLLVVAKPKSKCEKERDAATNGLPSVGAFTPQCESDGSYSSVQCHGSTGYCWCVDGEGNKLIETELRFERPNCTEGKLCTTLCHIIPNRPYHLLILQHNVPFSKLLVVAKPKSKCEKERDAATNGPPLVGAFTPQCESDGSYSSVQCHSSTGYCWCVDGEGNKLIETELRFERPNCAGGKIP